MTNPAHHRATNPMCTVERIHDTFVLMDQDGNVLDTHDIARRPGGRRAAKRVILAWLADATFPVAEALNLI